MEALRKEYPGADIIGIYDADTVMKRFALTSAPLCGAFSRHYFRIQFFDRVFPRHRTAFFHTDFIGNESIQMLCLIERDRLPQIIILLQTVIEDAVLTDFVSDSYGERYYNGSDYGTMCLLPGEEQTVYVRQFQFHRHMRPVRQYQLHGRRIIIIIRFTRIINHTDRAVG